MAARSPSAAIRSGAADVAAALVQVSPVVAAALPIGLVFGALAGQAGLEAGTATAMSAVVFAGASQFAALEQWGHPVPVVTVVAATLLVNLRHVAMSAALAPHLGRFPAAARPLALLGMTDEVWALALGRAAARPLTPGYYAGLAVTLWAAWVVSTAAGYVAGTVIDDPGRWGLDMAITAVFIGLLLGTWRRRADLAPWAASAAAAVTIERAGAPAMAVAAGIVAGLAAAAWQELRAPAGGGSGDGSGER